MTDEEIKEAALEFAKKNKECLARELTNPEKYIPDVVPASIFMAGSPGAGKTEFSKIFIDIFEMEEEFHVVRIDPDEVRSKMPHLQGRKCFSFPGVYITHR